MSSALSHPAIPLALAWGLGSGVVSRRLLLAGIAGSIVPDLDVYFPTDHPVLEHRGITHSLAFAALLGVLAAVWARQLHAQRWVAGLFVAAATASHGFIDGWTDGGAGILYLWPFTDERYTMPLRFIQVPPIGILEFISVRGLHVLWSELKWLWLPSVVLAIVLSWVTSALRARVTRTRRSDDPTRRPSV